MAEDDRRASVAQGERQLVIDPVADGDISAADRRHIAGFSRLLAASTTPFVFGGGGGNKHLTTISIQTTINTIF